ncbi:HEAT repeat domain-containing protein [Methanofollis formosanus]|uniref:HEAT repeat domain-containing protein n=1 Tax=Methanofollis formosanus TaxID=299308 RepID=A0A8G1EHN7_9EURY|nr:HEAT repeat domain-containing protein [Methanofollis formosanus]QYZ80207.1 HEAT repeat domain-containing protein [Methanofollis formosanus]
MHEEERELVVQEFLRNLNHERPEFRWGAAEALGRIGDSRAVAPLIKALEGDPDPRVRTKAAWALGRLGDPRAQRPLLRALGDRDDDVQEIAGEALEVLKRKLSLRV